MSDYLKDTTPLGKSVEEIERETQNTTNASTPGEERQDDGGLPIGLASTTATGVGVGSNSMLGVVGNTLNPGDGSANSDAQRTDRAGDVTDNDQA